MLLLTNLIGEKDINMLCRLLGKYFLNVDTYTNDIRFHDIPDRLVQGKKNNLLGILILYTLCTGRL